MEVASKKWVEEQVISYPKKDEWDTFLQGTAKAYADDIIIAFINKAHLKHLVQIVERWSETHKIGINKKDGKSNILYFHLIAKAQLPVNGINICTEYKYLGIILKSNASLKTEFDIINSTLRSFNKDHILKNICLASKAAIEYLEAYIVSKV